MTARTLARASLVVAGAFFLSRILGWLRLVVITNLFGASAELDAYFAAFRIPDAIFQLVVGGALGAALVPVVSSLLAKDEERRAWEVLSTVTNLLLLVMAVLALLLAIAAPVVMPAITAGFGPEQRELTVHLTRVMLLSPVILALGAITSAALNARGRFSASVLGPLVYNLVMIGAAVVLAPLMGVEGLAIGVVVASVAHLIVQLPAVIREGVRYRPSIRLGDPMARRAFLLMGPRALGLGVTQITFIVNTTLASLLGTGAIVAYNVAFVILEIPVGVIATGLGLVLLPSLSRVVATGTDQAFGAMVAGSLRLLMFVMFFLAGVGMVVRTELVVLLFGGGLDARAVQVTADTLLVFLAGLPAHATTVLLARAFYSAHDTRTPVMVAILTVIVHVSVSVAAIGSLGLPGLALGITLGAWFETTILAVLLVRRAPAVRLAPLVSGVATFALGALGAAASAAAVLRVAEAILGRAPDRLLLAPLLALATLGGAAAYLLYSSLVRVPEMPRLFGLLRSSLRRR